MNEAHDSFDFYLNRQGPSQWNYIILAQRCSELVSVDLNHQPYSWQVQILTIR